MEKDKDRDERTHDLYGEDDIPKSNILDITLFMDKNAKDVVDYLEQKTVEDYDPAGEIYDRILSKLVNEFPFGLQMADIIMIRFMLSLPMLERLHYG